MKSRRTISVGAVVVAVLAAWLAACSAGQKPSPKPGWTVDKSPPPPPPGPARLVLVDRPVEFQDQQEPFCTEEVFEFELPRRPRRARLVLRYSGVPGATSEDYLMGRFRHKVELNDAFLMDLNTHSKGEEHVVEHTQWISVGMFRRRNRLKFIAGDDGNRESRPDRDEFTLRAAVLELDW